MKANTNHFHCHFNNRGYCRYRDQCHFQHFSEICPKRVCRIKECEFRHPKPCRNKEKCKFFKLAKCVYKHEDDTKDDKAGQEGIRNKLKEYEIEVEKLKADVLELKQIVEAKEKELAIKAANEKEQSEVIANLRQKNSLEISDLKFSVKTKEIDLKERLAKEKELSNVINELRKENANLKEINGSLNTKLAQQQLKYLTTKAECDSKEEHKQIFHKCELCEKIFLDKADLTTHTNCEHDIPCKDCDLKFLTKIHLVVHITLQHDKRPEDLQKQKESESAFQCKICFKDLESLSNLKEHVQNHCRKCDNFFFDPNNFKNHLATCDTRFYFWHFKDGNMMKNIVKIN